MVQDKISPNAGRTRIKIGLYSALKMQVLIADDQRDVRSALRLLLEHQAEDCIIIEAADSESLLADAAGLSPDIIIIDAELKGIRLKKDPQSVRSFQNVVAELRELCPDARIVALTSRPDLHKLTEGSRVDVLISKADPPEALLDAIQKLCC